MFHVCSLAASPFGIVKEALPGWLDQYHILGISLADWVGLGGLALIAFTAGAIAQWVFLRASHLVTSRTSSEWDERLVAILPGLLTALIGLFLFGLATPLLNLGQTSAEGVEVLVRSLLILTLTILAMRLLTVAGEMLEIYLTRGVTDENRLRSVRTQVAVPRSILRVAVVMIGAALILLQFDFVRSVGVSLLASAGVAGIIIGLAAQKAVANLLAGIQLAIFQPIRIGDAVVVEGEWGWVEEIGLTHVVVKVWDQRRLVLPVSFFLDRPFQNWTRGESDLLGTVLVYADYTVSVEMVRKELEAILREEPLWDGRVQGLQVTNLTEGGVEVRALMSASDGGRLWDLRCLVREKLLTWLQTCGRPHLPVERVELIAASSPGRIEDDGQTRLAGGYRAD